MAEKHEYTVHRSMQSGAESFARGDTRQLTEAEAAPLVETGALSRKGQKPVERTSGVQHTFGTAKSSEDEFKPSTAEPSITVDDQRGARTALKAESAATANKMAAEPQNKAASARSATTRSARRK